MANLIVGLGNPGLRYKMTRHNIGFMVVEALAKRMELKWKSEQRLCGKLATWKRGEETTLLLMPETFMNGSGISVKNTADYYGLHPSDILVVVDDVAIPYKEMRLRERGSSGGHKGLESIESELKSQGYQRLRLGVGAPQGVPLEAYVLSSFTQEEKEVLPLFLEEAQGIVETWCRGGIKAASTRLSAMKKGEKSKDEKGENRAIRGDVYPQPDLE